MLNTTIETSHFDTRSLAITDRFEAWRESMEVIFDVETYDDAMRESFNAQVDSFLLDDIAINHCRLGAQAFTRDAARIARDGVDHYQVHVFLRGSVEMEFGGKAVSARVGDFVNLDHSEAFKSRTTDYEILNIFIPRRRLAPLLHEPDDTHGLVFDSRIGPGRLLRDYVVSLHQAVDEITLAQAPQAAEALVQLAALALNGAQVDDRDPPALVDHALLLRAQVYIKDNLSRPGLGPDEIAQGLGMSRARLYRVFRSCGGVSEYIREMRLRRAYTDLISPRLSHKQVALIAFDWGFKDPAHFTRLFSSRFGANPSEVRELGQSIPAGQREAVTSEAGDTKYAFWIASLS